MSTLTSLDYEPSTNSRNGIAAPPEKTVDDICCGLLDELYPRAGGTIWKAPIILSFKDIFEEQYQYIAIYGLQHRYVLSTPILVRIIHDLICNDFFTHHTPRTHLDLELHLRCVVAALRLLSTHGIQTGSGTMTFKYFDELYNRMSYWQNFHIGQVERIKKTEESLKNYNNEFLIVYARDLISSVPSDRTLATNFAKRMVAAVSMLGQAYAHNVVEAAQSLKTAIQVKHPPSPWHDTYRTMDELCLSIRVFRQLSSQNHQPSVDEWINNIPDFLETAEGTVINQLTEILFQDLQNSISKDKMGTAIRKGGDALGTAPVARKDHFTYGILDLVQQHIHPIDSGKINYKVMEVCLRVLSTSPYSYLRCKAFEVLASMSAKPGIGQAPIGRVNQLLASDTWPMDQREKIATQWKIMQKRRVDVEFYFTDLRNKSPRIKQLTQSTLEAHESSSQGPSDRSIDKILSLVASLEDSLVCPIGIEDEPVRDLSPLPCGHFVSQRSWRMYEAKNPGKKCRCPTCNAEVDRIGEPLPMGRIGEIIKNIREECELLRGLAEWNRDVPQSHPIPPHPELEPPLNDIPHEISTKESSPLIDFDEPIDEIPVIPSDPPSEKGKEKAIFISGDRWNEVVRAPPRRKPTPPGQTQSSPPPLPPSLNISSDSPLPKLTISPALSPWTEEGPDDWNPTSAWETEAKERDLRRFSDDSHGNRLSQSDTDRSSKSNVGHDSAYFTLSPITPAGMQTPTHPPYEGHADLPSPILGESAFSKPPFPLVLDDGLKSPIREEPVPREVPVQKEEEPSINKWAEFQSKDRMSYGSGLVEKADVTSYLSSTPLPPIKSWRNQSQGPKSTGPTQSASANQSTSVSQPASARQSVVSEPPPSTVPLTRDRADSVLSQRTQVNVDTSVRTSSAPSEAVTSPRKSFGSIRKFSLSSHNQGSKPPADDAASIMSDASSTSTNRGFHLKAVGREHIDLNKTFVATAISETCLTIGFVTSHEFYIYTVGEKAMHRLICCGFSDGRVGESANSARKDLETLANPRDFEPTYLKAAMTDRVLCIACAESCVDVHITPTGRKIATLEFPGRKCSSIAMSPNRELLAVGMESGEILIYNAGAEENFNTPPRSVKELDGRSINCVTFSPNSRILGSCSVSNIIRIYNLLGDVKRLSTYNRQLDAKSCRGSYYGVTAIAFSPNSSSLLVIADAENAYPVVVNNITLPEEQHEPYTLSGKDTYKYKNCCVAYSPLFNAALIITRSGTAKLANCSTGFKTWTVAELPERLDAADKHWQACSVGFSRDGRRALALDHRGKILMADFT